MTFLQKVGWVITWPFGKVIEWLGGGKKNIS